jgi:UDP-3-O-[3-hydroxymyristoyl] glucosamine N-acyltransferase
MRLSELSLPRHAELVRDGDFKSIGYLNSRGEDCLSCIYDSGFKRDLEENKRVSCIIATADLVELVPPAIGLVVVDDPLICLLAIHEQLARKTEFYRKKSKTEIGSGCQIHPTAVIDDDNVRIGNNVFVGPGTVIHENTTIGNDVTLRANCVLGTPGFEFKRRGDTIISVYHAGGVRLGDRVELQASTCVSRSVFGDDTEIGDDTKTDNLVHIAHNVKIGKRCLLAANAMIAGSVTMGDDVWIGPGAQISSGVEIGDRAAVTLGSVVTKPVAADHRVTGNFAIDHKKFIRFLTSIR